MPYTITREDSITVFRFQSSAEFEDLKRAIAEIDTTAAAPFEIWNLTSPGIALTSVQVRSLAVIAKAKKHHPRKTAIVAHNELSFGLSRLYSVHREQPENETRVFTNDDSAREWFLSSD